MKYTLNCKGRLFYANEPKVMGILNVTPDSFYTKGRKNTLQQHIDAAGSMLEEGAAILDFGGMSTRPGATQISAIEEADRVVPVVEAVRKHFNNAFISIDTFNATVANDAVIAGADMVNDISAGDIDDAMISTVAKLQIPYIAMHMKGTPKTMQQNPEYENVTEAVLAYFSAKVVTFQKAGIKDVLLDPGFGFGKTLHHNYTLLKKMEALTMLQKPLLVGVSRKSMAYKLLQIAPEEALNASTALHMLALQNGADILRVHDVKEAKQCIDLFNYYQTI